MVHPNLNIRYCPKTKLDDLGYKGALFNPFYLTESYKMMKDSNSDIIQCEPLWSILSGVLLKKKFDKPLILVDQNVEYLKFKQLGKSHYCYFVRKLEKTGCEYADKIIVVSEVDKSNIMKLYATPEEKIETIRNSVDTEAIRYSEEGRIFVRNMYNISDETVVLAFLGKLDYTPNFVAVRYIAERIYPAIVKMYPRSKFLIIGKNHEPLLRYKRDNMIFTGYVNNLQGYLSASDIFLAPLDSGSGTRLKILEAASCSRPIVSTEKGAEGLDFLDGKEIVMAENVDERFIESVLELIKDEELRETIGKNARKKVESQYNWGEEIRKFNEVYEELES